MEEQIARQKIRIDGEWSLEDLYVFPRAYEQVYFLLASFETYEEETVTERIDYAFRQFPWQGGYSAVNFYDRLKHAHPKAARPQVVSLRYSSPGWIELSVITAVFLSAKRIVMNVSSMIKDANSAYNDIYRGMQERKILRIEVKRAELRLEEEHQEFIERSALRMAQLMPTIKVQEINRRTGSSLKTLKILLSLYRRIRTLAKYENDRKTKL